MLVMRKNFFSPFRLITQVSLVVALVLVSLWQAPAAWAAAPSVSVTYTGKSSYFMVVAKNTKTINYTIEYVRAAGGGSTITEGLSGGGKGTKKTGLYLRRHFAGTQSSRYYIPHNVKSGQLIASGTDMSGQKFNKTIPFSIVKGRLIRQ